MSNVGGLIGRAAGRTKLLVVKNAPALMTYGGIAVVGVGIYLFCKASRKVEPVIFYHEEQLDEIQDRVDSGELTRKEANREIFAERRDYCWELTKLYGPAVTTTLTGFALILGGHHVISKRSAAISAAYKALEEGYHQYRQRVREDLGSEADRKYLYGLKEEQAEVTVVGQDGKEKKIETTVYKPHDKTPEEIIQNLSPYARFFDESSTQWSHNPEYNLMFLNAQQNYANDKLHAVGHLFLNEVYEMLGLPHTKAGSVVGWVMNKGGDNCVDFGIYDLHNQIKRAFVNGFEPSILLDFNVDGVIYDLI